MRLRIAAISLAVLAATLLLAAGAGAAALIGIYRNGMESEGQKGEVAKLYGDRCGRGGSDHAFRIVVGKATGSCAYATPVVGRDLEIAAVGRLLSSTPKKLRHRAYVSLNLRAGSAGAGYQLVVFPLQRKAQLRKVTTDGKIKFLRIAKRVNAVGGIDEANRMRLRAFNVTSGPEKGQCRIRAFVGGNLVADYVDTAAGELQGRASGFAVGAGNNARYATASFDDVVLRVPSPFQG